MVGAKAAVVRLFREWWLYQQSESQRAPAGWRGVPLMDRPTGPVFTSNRGTRLDPAISIEHLNVSAVDRFVAHPAQAPTRLRVHIGCSGDSSGYGRRDPWPLELLINLEDSQQI